MRSDLILSGPFQPLAAHNGSQVFTAPDNNGQLHIVVGVGDRRQPEGLLAAATTPEQAADFQSGRLDLNALLLDAPEGRWYHGPMPDRAVASLHFQLQETPSYHSPYWPLRGLIMLK